MTSNKKVFCIGNSRTGTTSLYYFLKALGFNAIHHYEYVLHGHKQENGNSDWNVLNDFISGSGYEAFSDYPTRTYYKEIYELFPDAYYINTARNLESLNRSICSYFSFNDNQAATWLDHHAKAEAEIHEFFKTKPNAKFLDVNMQEEGELAEERIKQFLCMGDSPIRLGVENKSDKLYGINYIDNLPSLSKKRLGFYDLFNPPEPSSLLDTVQYLEQSCQPAKSLPSESSHFYLINDASSSIRQYLGLPDANGRKLKLSIDTYDELRSVCESVGSFFRVFAVPEKYSVYPEFLPRCLTAKWFSDIFASVASHPSLNVGENRPYFINTLKFILLQKSYGDLYYHGDTHLSSQGARRLLILINAIMLNDLNINLYPIPDNFATPCIGSWLGDLAAQVPEDLRSYIHQFYGHNQYLPRDQNGQQNISYIVHFPPSLPSNIEQLPFDISKYPFLSSNRPKQIIINKNAPIPKKLLVFRDSTATNLLPSLSCLYQEVVSIWDRAFHLRPSIVKDEQPDYTIAISADRFICEYS